MHKISLNTLLTVTISLLLFAVCVPLSFVMFYEHHEISMLEKKKIGAEMIPEIQKINMLIAKHRGTTNRYLNGNKSLMPTLKELENEIDAQITNSAESCPSREAKIESRCADFAMLQTQWNELKNNYPSLSIDDSVIRHITIIANLLAYDAEIADNSLLSLDNETISYYLINTIVETLPNLIESIGQLRSFGSGLVVQREMKKELAIGLSDQIEIAKHKHVIQLSLKKVHSQLEKVFITLPELAAKQEGNLYATTEKTEAFLTLVDSYFIQHNKTINDQEFFNESTKLISEIMTLYTPLVEALQNELDNRNKESTVKSYVTLAVSIMLIAVLMTFLYYFKRRLLVLNHAISCFEQLSAENYNHPIEIKYHDEIGQLLGALQLMRHHLSSNMKKLKYNLLRLTEAQRIAQLGDWEWDVQADKWHCSEEMYRILGITENIALWNLERFLNSIQTADRNHVVAILALAQQSAGNYEIEYQMYAENNEKKVIHQRIESHVNAQGEVVHLVGTMQDVTLRREMETKIRLAAEVFEHVGEAIVVTDEKNKVTLINNVFSKITGYYPNEVIGQNPNFLSSGEHNADFYRTMWHDIKTTGIWKGEVWNYRKDGSRYPEMLTITTIRNNAGEIVNHIGIFSDITIQKRASEQIEYLANYDALTSLMNRRALEVAAKQAIAAAKRHQHLVALLFIDLDGFKAVNDNLGHDVGDEVLKITAERLRSSVRECDLIARLGGDEFVVVLTDLSDFNSITPIADKIVIALNQTLTGAEKTLHVTPSIGISVYSENYDDYEKLLTSADKAMYAAKTHGKNNYQFAP